MISKHCGQSLRRTSTQDSRLTHHRWRCVVCKKVFTQRRRQPKGVGESLIEYLDRLGTMRKVV